MKNLRIFVSMMVLSFFLGANVYAQQPAKEQPAKEQPGKDVSQTSPKEEWLKQYDALKPKLDTYLAKVKEQGTNHPEFAQEVKKLDVVMTDFRNRIDKFDSATAEERANYESTMKQIYKRVQDQEAKVKAEWDKIQSEKATPEK